MDAELDQIMMTDTIAQNGVNVTGLYTKAWPMVQGAPVWRQETHLPDKQAWYFSRDSRKRLTSTLLALILKFQTNDPGMFIGR